MMPPDFIAICAAEITIPDTEALRTVLPDSEASFLTEISCGMQEQRNVILPAIKVFFDAYAGRIARSDRTKCYIITYLLLFHLERMGIPDFERHVTATNAPLAMQSLLAFFTDECTLHDSLSTAWREQHDDVYIQKLTTPLREASSELKELCARVLKPSERKVSLPRLVKEPIRRLPELTRAKPDSKSRNRFVSNQEQVIAPQMPVVPFKATPMPQYPNSGPEIKLTTAVILREDAMYQRNQAKAAALLQAFETELRDSLPFYQWKAQMQQQDDRAQASVMAARRLEMAQAQHIAKEAAIAARNDNKRVAQSMKMIAKNLDVERTRQSRQTLSRHRQQMTQIKHIRECAPRNAQDQLRRDKRSQAAELTILLEQERAQKALQVAAEQSKREETLRAIRALHTARGPHIASFDPSETAQLGLLDEMSQSELEARLRAQKAEIAEKEVEKRREIARAKSEKTGKLEGKMANLMRIREARSTQSRRQRMLSQQNQARTQQEHSLAAEQAKADALKAIHERTAKWDAKAADCKRQEKKSDKMRHFRKRK
ncbi:hypothetical protein ABG067_006013 [Albugo candida]